MNKEVVQIVIGVSTVALIGVGVILYVNRNTDKPTSTTGKTGSVRSNILNKLSAQNRAQVMRVHPNARKKFAEFIYAVEKMGYKVVITSGYRTFDKQAQLYRQNKKNARAGYSNHNYGYALDINIIDPATGKTVLRKATSNSRWTDSGIVDIAKKMGMKWGGDFKNYYDPIHFYIPRDKSTAEMKSLVEKGRVDREGYVLAFAGLKQPDFELNMPNEWAA